MQECTFHPAIRTTTNNHPSTTERYMLLHEDFYIRQNKAQTAKASQAKIISQLQQPRINEVSRRMVGDRSFE
jgi:hypothetical protein